MEVGVFQKLEVHPQTVMLPKEVPTTLASTRQITKNRKCKLLQWGTGFDNTFQARDNASLSSFFLPRFVQPTEVITRLENVIGQFLVVVKLA